MAIISANRYGKLNGKIMFATNESYGMDDIGRILQENEINEMNLFNAILKSDMSEIKARTEGTMLESELTQLQEASLKNFYKAVADKLRAFWEKIKGVFKDAYANLAAYAVKYGNVYLKANKAKIDALTDDSKVPGKFLKLNEKDGVAACVSGCSSRCGTSQLVNKEVTAKTAADFNELFLSMAIGKAFDGKKDTYTAMKETVFTEIDNGTLKAFGGKSHVIETIKDASQCIKSLRSLETEFEKTIVGDIRDAEKRSKEAGDAAGSAIYAAAASGSTTAISSMVRSGIKLVKLQVAQSRKVLVAAIGASAKTEASLLESMLLEAEEEASAISSETSEDLTSEQEELVDAIIDAAEALKDDGEETPAEEEPTGDVE